MQKHKNNYFLQTSSSDKSFLLLYKIIHTTTYSYNEPVSLCHNIARLIPRSFDNQLCKKSIVTISPLPDVKNEYEDFFGNKVMYFAIQQEHKNIKTPTKRMGNEIYPHINKIPNTDAEIEANVIMHKILFLLHPFFCK